MKFIVFLSLALVATSLLVVVSSEEQQQQRVIRRIVKSGRLAERDTEQLISFGKRSSSESSNGKSKLPTSVTQLPQSSNLSATTITTPANPINARQQNSAEVESLSSAPSSWQMMTAIDAPAFASIARGTRQVEDAVRSNDLSSSSSEDSSLSNQDDFLRSPTGIKGNFAPASQTFSSLRQETSKTKTRQQQQQPFFYPQQQRQGKTSNYQSSKTNWYQPSSTTPRPTPIVQEQQQYEQQNEQYVEQQQVDSAPPGQAEPFAFDFNTQDTSGNGQYRKEESDNNGVVRGSYGFHDASGMYRHVEYVADQDGFRANIKSNEPGVEGGPDSQPASIKLDGGAAPSRSRSFTNSNNDNTDWTATSSSSDERADLVIAPPDFESSHKADRVRSARHSKL